MPFINLDHILATEIIEEEQPKLLQTLLYDGKINPREFELLKVLSTISKTLSLDNDISSSDISEATSGNVSSFTISPRADNEQRCYIIRSPRESLSVEDSPSLGRKILKSPRSSLSPRSLRSPLSPRSPRSLRSPRSPRFLMSPKSPKKQSVY